MRRFAELEAEGLMAEAGGSAFARRREDRTAVYSHEQAVPPVLDEAFEARFQAEAPAGLDVVRGAGAVVPAAGVALGDEREEARDAGAAAGDADRRLGREPARRAVQAARGPVHSAGHGVGQGMKLYDRVERIHHELRALGIADDAPLTSRQLVQFDQYHYHGTDAVDEAAARLGIDASSRVLDVGAGIGGPARWLAATTGCHVTALELQPDLNATAADLTRRSGLADRVTHVAGDILDGAPVDGGYDALISYLAVLHIPDRARLFAACHRALVPGGGMYIEDFTLRSEPTPAQREALRVKVQCPYVPPPDVYRQDILDAGFERVELGTSRPTGRRSRRSVWPRSAATATAWCASTARRSPTAWRTSSQRWPASTPTASWAAPASPRAADSEPGRKFGCLAAEFARMRGFVRGLADCGTVRACFVTGFAAHR